MAIPSCPQAQPAGSHPPLLHLRDVQRRIADKHTVHHELNAEMRFDRAEVIGVFGANGAGKSTLMDLIAGRVDPSAGQVQVRGLALDSIRREDRRNLVRHHAQAHLAAPQTGRLQAMVLSPRDWLVATRETVRNLLRKKAPGGDPQVFVFDEPPLEQPYGGLLFNRFVQLRDQGNLVFFSAHPYEPWHLKAIQDICDRYVFLEGGRPTLLNSFEEFMAHPSVVDYFSGLDFVRRARSRHEMGPAPRGRLGPVPSAP